MASKINVDKIARGSGTPEFTIPTADGTAGQFLKTDGSGVLAFDTVTGTTINNNANNRIISGSATANTLEGEANLTYDGTSLGVKNAGTASDIKVYCENANSHYTSIKSAAHAAYTGGSWTMTLPGTDGTASQFLQTDGAGATTWATAGGNNSPAFYVWRQTSHQAIPHDTETKVAFNGEIYDPDDVFDSTTNYRFTVPAGEGGNYFLFWDISFEAASNTTFVAWSFYLKVNGTTKKYSHTNYSGNYIRRTGIPGSVMLALSDADYVEIWVAGNPSNSVALDVNYSTGYVHTGFGGFKLL